MTQRSTFLRKCSPTVAAVAGAAVCLSNQGALAAVHTGNISASNGGQITFTGGGNATGTYMAIFSSNVTVHWANSVILYWSSFLGINQPRVNGSGATYINFLNAGVDVNSGIVGGFDNLAFIRPSQGPSYLGVRYNDGTNKFGWIQVISTDAGQQQIILGAWGYDDSGASIKTLSDTLTARKLTLSNGKIKLHWTNKNEDGVSRYEIQAKDDKGEWQAVDSDVPGEGRYNVKADSKGAYRLVVEKVDGTTEEVAF